MNIGNDFGLNSPVSLILIEDLSTETKPISRLIAYLCIKYHVQAMTVGDWGDEGKP